MIRSIIQQHKSDILRAAREAIEACVHRKPAPISTLLPDDIGINGVFVSIYVDDALRGCIGFVTFSEPFPSALAEAAQKAAGNDPRFAPITKNELRNMNVDVTLLGPLEDIRKPEDIELGIHGLRIEHANSCGLLLPQVAIVNKWTQEQFLSAVCQKAYLPSETWKVKEARISRFRGYVLCASRDSDNDHSHLSVNIS